MYASVCGFFDTYSQRITYEVPTRYRADTGEDTVKSTQKFLSSIIVAVGPIRYRLRLYKVPTAIVKILAGTFPLSADPGKVFFHNFDFETVLPVSKTTACRNFPVLIQFELSPTRYSVFCSGRTLIQSGAYRVVKPLKSVFCYLKGRGPLKKVKNLRKCSGI